MDHDTIKVGVQGRITIPKHLRDKYSIKHLDGYKIHVMSDVIILEKIDKRKKDTNMRSLEEYFSL